MEWLFKRHKYPGLTLIELLVVLTVVAIALLVATPTLQQTLHRNRLSLETSRLLMTLNVARSEAISRNIPVSVCPSSYALTGLAMCGGVYAGGWIVFSNSNRDRIVDLGVDEILRVFHSLPAGYTLTNRAGTRSAADLITYYPDGTSRRSLTLLLCSPFGDADAARSVVLNRVGRPRVAKDWGECPDSHPV